MSSFVGARTATFETLMVPGRGGGHALVIMLPGVGLKAQDFVDNGLVASLQCRYPGTDVLALGVDTMAYLGRTLVAALHDEVVLLAKRSGYRKIAFAGISLGGMGTLLYARHHGQEIAAAVLLAPFLGTPGLIAEISRAGAFGAWEPGEIRPSEFERDLLAWLKAYGAGEVSGPPLYLGFATEDRFAQGARLLAAILRPEHVIVRPGIHDWTAWRDLWSGLLERGAFEEVQ